MRIRGEHYLKLRGSDTLQEKVAEQEEWWQWLLTRPEATGVSRKDVGQIQPGAGMTVEEVQQVYMNAGGPADQV
jgi:hypothetical protein